MLHHGDPVAIDADWWYGQASPRRSIAEPRSPRRTARPASRSPWENDGFPGLVVDRYGMTFVVKAYSEAWLPHVRAVADALRSLAGPERIVLRLGRVAQRAAPAFDGVALSGRLPAGPCCSARRA